MTDTTTHDLGTVHTTDDGRVSLVFTRHLNHSADRVWGAITNSSELELWLAHKAVLDARIGGDFVLWLGGDADGSPGPQRGVITALDVRRRLEVDFVDGSTLRFELSQVTDGCVFTFTDVRPAGERARNGVFAGWHLRMDALAPALGGTALDWVALDNDRDENGYVNAIVDIYWRYRNRPRA